MDSAYRLQVIGKMCRSQRGQCEWMRSMRIKYSPASLVCGRLYFLPRILAGLTTCALFMFHGSDVSAQSPDPFEDLRLRIAQLEKDNHELRTAFSKRPDDPFVPMIS